jgi:long-chain fatty acid transport protein
VAPPATAEALVQIDAEGWAPTFDVATQVRLGDRVKLGASYRHQAVVEHNGWAHVQGVGDFAATTKFALPSTFTTGVAVKAADWWTVAFDWDFTYWESFRDLSLQVPSNPLLEGGFRAASPFPNRKWKNSHIFRLGTEFQVARPLAVRLGYAYITTPIPDETLDPVLPDSDRTSLTGGFGYKITDRLTLDFAYEYEYFHERAKNNGVLVDTTAPANLYDTFPGLRANGTYNTDAHVFVTQLKYVF